MSIGENVLDDSGNDDGATKRTAVTAGIGNEVTLMNMQECVERSQCLRNRNTTGGNPGSKILRRTVVTGIKIRKVEKKVNKTNGI